jgi:hypothetical protein
MVLYMQQAGDSAVAGLYAAVWNGKFGSPPSWTQISSSHKVLTGALFLGTVGSNAEYSNGAAKTSVQLFSNSLIRWEFSYNESGVGTWMKDKQRWLDIEEYATGPRAFLWYDTECSKGLDNQIVRQHVVLNSDANSKAKGMRIRSDAMVPLNKDDLGLNCSAWGGTTTATNIPDSDTSEDAVTFRKYWTLVGVILGSPPFSLNNWGSFELEDFSNVTYGSESSGQVSHTEDRESSLMFSAGLTVTGGLAHVFGVKDDLDLSYKYGWNSKHETTSTMTKGVEQTFGTKHSNTDKPDDMGKYGWAIFNVPTMVVQDYALYAYDYDVDKKTGTALGQDLHSVQVLSDSTTVVPKAFELANPGGPNDDVPGLLTGMSPFAKSTNLGWWSAVPWTWESKTSPWSVVLGEKADAATSEAHINTLTFTNGAGSSVYFSQDKESVNSTGMTSDIGISNKTEISVGTKLKGFKTSLAAGYDSHFGQSVTNSTSWEKSVAASLGMKACSEPGCVKSMTIQPYLLKAVNQPNGQIAPWIPTKYNSQQPWCMTWSINGYTTNPGAQVGMSALPQSANVTMGTGSASKQGSVTIKGGSLAWLDERGQSLSATMTADSFDPEKGASVTLNGFRALASKAVGKWTRTGQTWRFDAKESSKHDRMTLTLDFAAHAWEADITHADLAAPTRSSMGALRLNLLLNDKLGFQSAFTAQVHSTWAEKITPRAEGGVALTRYAGEYDSAKGEGSVTIEGRLPRRNDVLGDISFAINGRQISVPLLSHAGYAEAVSKGKTLSHDEAGVGLVVDFGKRTWKASFAKTAFHPLLAPRGGRSRVVISMGGVRLTSQELALTTLTTNLSFQR